MIIQYENHLLVGAYSEAADITQREAERKNNDELMWRLLCGNARMLAADSPSAAEQFDLAEDLFIANDTQSVFASAGENTKAMLGSDASFKYNGVGQDRIFCCLYKAIEYAVQGNVAATRTELNRASQYQENWLFDRRKDIANAQERLDKEMSKVPEKERVAGVDAAGAQRDQVLSDEAFRNSVLARCGIDSSAPLDLSRLAEAEYSNAYVAYFTGVFRWLNGDGGRGFLRDAANWRPECHPAAQDFNANSSGATPGNDVWIFVEDGLCSSREEWRVDLPLFILPGLGQYVLYAGMALPALLERDAAAISYQAVTPESPAGTPLALLESIDELLKVEYEIYMKGAIAREISRAIVKTSAQIALGIAADNADSMGAFYSLKAAQIGAGAWAASTTEADIRSWVSLPKYVYTQHLQRPANGKISLVANTATGNEMLQLDIPEGNTIVWVRKLSPTTPMVAKIVTYPSLPGAR